MAFGEMLSSVRGTDAKSRNRLAMNPRSLDGVVALPHFVVVKPFGSRVRLVWELSSPNALASLFGVDVDVIMRAAEWEPATWRELVDRTDPKWIATLTEWRTKGLYLSLKTLVNHMQDIPD